MICGLFPRSLRYVQLEGSVVTSILSPPYFTVNSIFSSVASLTVPTYAD